MPSTTTFDPDVYCEGHSARPLTFDCAQSKCVDVVRCHHAFCCDIRDYWLEPVNNALVYIFYYTLSTQQWTDDKIQQLKIHFSLFVGLSGKCMLWISIGCLSSFWLISRVTSLQNKTRLQLQVADDVFVLAWLHEGCEDSIKSAQKGITVSWHLLLLLNSQDQTQHLNMSVFRNYPFNLFNYKYTVTV